MRGLRSDLGLLRPLTRERPTCYWLLSDASEAARASGSSDGQFVFHHSDPVLAYLGDEKHIFPSAAHQEGRDRHSPLDWGGGFSSCVNHSKLMQRLQRGAGPDMERSGILILTGIPFL